MTARLRMTAMHPRSFASMAPSYPALRAVVRAHVPCLVVVSITGRIQNTRLSPGREGPRCRYNGAPRTSAGAGGSLPGIAEVDRLAGSRRHMRISFSPKARPEPRQSLRVAYRPGNNTTFREPSSSPHNPHPIHKGPPTREMQKRAGLGAPREDRPREKSPTTGRTELPANSVWMRSSSPGLCALLQTSRLIHGWPQIARYNQICRIVGRR